MDVVLHALDRGVRLIDTAPAYGDAESVVGEALRQWRGARPRIATKAAIGPDTTAADVRASASRSRDALGVDRLDLLQIHSATLPALANEAAIEAMREQADAVGASIYTEAEAMAALDRRVFGVLQVPFNLLDQKMAAAVFARAAGQSCEVLVRSAFLRGVLTDRLSAIPEPLAPLREAARRALAIADLGEDRLAALALRFCLAFDAVSSVIIGVRDIAELDANLESAGGELPAAVLERRAEFAVSGGLESPANWTGLI